MDSFKKKLFVEIGIGVLIIVPLVVGIAFFSSQVERFGDQIAATRRDIFARTAALESLADLRAAYSDKTKRSLEALYNMVPVKDQLINLARDFQVLGAQSKLNASFTFLGESPASEGKLGSVTFRLNLNGGLDNLIGFVERFEQFRYLSALSSFSLMRGQESSGMITQGSVYYR